MKKFQHLEQMAKNMLSTQGGTPPLKKHVDAKMLFRAFRAKENKKNVNGNFPVLPPPPLNGKFH